MASASAEVVLATVFAVASSATATGAEAGEGAEVPTALTATTVALYSPSASRAKRYSVSSAGTSTAVPPFSATR